MRRSSFILLLALVSIAAPASAQRRSASELRPGDHVRVWISGTSNRLQGTITANNERQFALRLATSSEERQVLWPGVERIDQRLGADRGGKAKHSAKLGAIFGAAMGAAFGIAVMKDCDVIAPSGSNCPAAAVFLTVAGAGAGAATGALLGAISGFERWARIPLATTSQQDP